MSSDRMLASLVLLYSVDNRQHNGFNVDRSRVEKGGRSKRNGMTMDVKDEFTRGATKSEVLFASKEGTSASQRHSA